MTQEEFDRTIRKLPASMHAVYKVFVALDCEKGIGAPDLSAEVPGTTWKPRAGGLTKEIDSLRARGLLRKVGVRKTGKGGKSLLFRVTAPDEVEGAMAAFKREGPGLGKDAKRLLDPDDPVRILRKRLREYSVLEHPSFTGYWTRRRQIADITLALIDMDEMVFWDCTHMEDHDFVRATEEMTMLFLMIDRTLDALEQRREEDRMHGKLEKMENNNGRGGYELENVKGARRRIRARIKKLQDERVTN